LSSALLKLNSDLEEWWQQINIGFQGNPLLLPPLLVVVVLRLVRLFWP
jgi:hypothetical protein